MINSQMQSYNLKEQRVGYDSLNVEIKTYVNIDTIQAFITLRSTEDKFIDMLSYDVANYIGITPCMTVCKDNQLVKDTKTYNVIEVFKGRNYSQLFLKEVN